MTTAAAPDKEKSGLEKVLAEIEVLVRAEASAFASAEEKELAVTVARDLATLYGKKLMGDPNVDKEIAHSKSAAMSLSGAAKNRVSYAVGRVFEQLLNKLAALLLTVI